MGIRRRGAAMLVLVLGLAACSGGDDGSQPADAPASDSTVTDTPDVDSAIADAATDGAEIDSSVSDATIDAAALDAATDAAIDGSGTCDPLAPLGQQGCIVGQKCTWIRTQETPQVLGRLGCVPDGNVVFDGACVQGPPGQSTGYDNCAGGLICIGGRCKDICGFDGSVNAACAVNYTCTRYSGLFANPGETASVGACNPTCNPLTQLRDIGGTCGANMGCYLLTSTTSTIAVCAGAGSLMHNVDIVGTSFANSCVPGVQPRRKDQASMTSQCGGLCAPADVTSTTNMADEAGVAPYGCSRWGAAPPQDIAVGESCRYWWAREAFTTLSPYSNTVGWCFKHAVFQFDSNNDQVPDMLFPRCTVLTTGDVVPPIGNPPHSDAQYFWCVATPAMLTGAVQGVRKWHARFEPRLDQLGDWR